MTTTLRPRKLVVLSAAFCTLVAAAAVDAQDTLVPLGSSWRYLDNGTFPGSTWITNGFADGAWQQGPAQLGYGDGDESTVVSFGPNPNNKYITTYFRTHFSVPSPAQYTVLRLRLLRDDGAVVYLNGSEIVRSNMTSGGISPTTLASSAVGGSDEETLEPHVVMSSLLIAGDNVLAVEIHQRSVDSSDLSFDLELSGYTELAPVIRGPYLQQVSSDRAILRWRTALPSGSRAELGLTVGSTTLVFEDTNPKTEHTLVLSGLTPQTRYYYAFGNPLDTLVGGDVDHTFVTSPGPSQSAPLRVWVIGDSGTGDANAAAVRDAFLASPGANDTALWLMLGDNAYENGTDANYQHAVFDLYPEILRRVPVWPTLGNHDASSASSAGQLGPYYDIFTLPTAGEVGGLASGTEAYYSFDHANVHFVCLDSHDTNRNPGSAMLTWLANDLATTDRDWIVAFWHHPPYTKGSHDSDDVGDSSGRMRDMRENVLPILEAGGVDLVLNGHSHSYERSVLLDGHYGTSGSLTPAMVIDGGDGNELADGAYLKSSPGPSSHEGTVYAVAGSSGKTSGGPLNHPVMTTSQNVLGSMVLDFDGGRLDAHFLRADGAITDRFTMIKGPAQDFIRGDANQDGSVDLADAISNLQMLFSGAVFGCLQALDGNSDGNLDVSDPVYLLNALFAGGQPPAAPYPNCGPGSGALSCAQSFCP